MLRSTGRACALTLIAAFVLWFGVTREANAATRPGLTPVPIDEALAAPEGYLAHLRALQRARVYVLSSHGALVPIDLVLDEYGFRHRTPSPSRAGSQQLRVPLRSYELASRASVDPATASARASATATARPPRAILSDVSNAQPAPNACSAAYTVCAHFQQAGDISFAVPDDYPKHFLIDPFGSKQAATATLERQSAHAFSHDANANCIEDVALDADPSAIDTEPIACPGTMVTIDLPGCTTTCALQRARVAIGDAFAFISYEPSPDCAAEHFVIGVAAGNDDGNAHALTFTIDRPGVGTNNVAYVCGITVKIAGPAGQPSIAP